MLGSGGHDLRLSEVVGWEERVGGGGWGGGLIIQYGRVGDVLERRRGNHLDGGSKGEWGSRWERCRSGGQGWTTVVVATTFDFCCYMPEFVCWRGCGGDGVGSTYKRNRGVWCIEDAFLVQQCL